MIACIVSHMIDGEMKVTEGYVDTGGLKKITKDQVIDVTWFSTVTEVCESVGASMYKVSQTMDVKDNAEIRSFVGLPTTEFVARFSGKFIF